MMKCQSSSPVDVRFDTYARAEVSSHRLGLGMSEGTLSAVMLVCVGAVAHCCSPASSPASPNEDEDTSLLRLVGARTRNVRFDD